jgi:hypothetical protein
MGVRRRRRFSPSGHSAGGVTAIVVPGMVERGRFEVSSDGTVEAVSFGDGESATGFNACR